MEFVTDPWKHQLRVAQHIDDNRVDYYALLWDMGTGKTKTGTDILRAKCIENQRQLRTLIVCPLAVQENWKREILTHSHISEKVIQVVDGITKPCGKKLKNPQKKLKMQQLQTPDKEIFIVTIPTIKYFTMKVKKSDRLDTPWGLVEELGIEFLLIDEVHNLKDYTGTWSKGVHRLTRQEQLKYRFILTGSPILQNALDLWSQFYILNPNILGKNFSSFRARYFYDANAGMPSAVHFPDWQPKDEAYFEKMGNYTEDQDLNKLNDIIYRHADRVMKADVLDLPERTYQTLEAEFSKEQKKMYTTFRDSLVALLEGGKANRLIEDAFENDESISDALPSLMSADLAIVKTLRLMQLANGIFTTDAGKIEVFETPKLKLLKETLQSVAANPENKIIIWTVFAPTYEQLGNICADLGLKYVYYTGLQNKTEKDDNKDAFQNDPSCRVIIANQAAGGTGLTLTAANYEFKYSRGFKLGDELQSDSRAYRGGQKRQTTCINFVVKDSIEEKCVKRLQEKAEHAEDILAKNNFSRDEILGMV